MNAVDDPLLSSAQLPPVLVRTLLRVAQQRGASPARLCQGLGFEPEALKRAALRVSYRQTRELAARVRAALDEPALGLALGQAQTPLSWGLPGLAMLACRTLGQAMAFCATYQLDVGACVSHRLDLQADAVVVQARPCVHDPAFEPLLIEESFAAIVTVTRVLVGTGFAPSRVEFAYPQPAHVAAYRRVFGCALHFDAPANRLLAPPRWLAHELASWDPFGSDALRAQLVSMLPAVPPRDELLESALAFLRARVEERVPITALAHHLNLGERTLRRRLEAQGVSYRGLLDQARREHALALLQRDRVPVREVAWATGFSDARAFRRAFKRWTGARPTDRLPPV